MTESIQNLENLGSVRAKLNQNIVDVAALQAEAALSFDTVAALLADSTLTYVTDPAGSIIEAGGFRYEVAASAASDQHVTTAGGVKLYVLSSAGGGVTPQQFGAVGDGTTNDAVALQSAISYCNASGTVDLVLNAMFAFSAQLTATKDFKVKSNGVDCGLKWTGNAATAFVWAAESGQDQSFVLEDILINNTGTLTTSFFDVTPRAIGLANKTVSIVGCRMWRTSGTIKNWVTLNSVRNAIILQNSFNGINDTGSVALDFAGQCLDCDVSLNTFTEGDIAIRSNGTSEGIRITQNTAVAVGKFVEAIPSGTGEPWICITGNHANCSVGCVDLGRYFQSIVEGNLLYLANSSGAAYGIRLDGAGSADTKNNRLSGNIFNGAVSTGGTTTGIDIASGNNISITDNVYIDLDVGINMQAGSSSVFHTGATFNIVTSEIVDAGTNNVHIARLPAGMLISAQNNADLRLQDRGATSGSRLGMVRFNDGVFEVVGLDDAGSITSTAARFAPTATSIGGGLGSEALRATFATSAVNRVEITGAVTGGAATIKSEGSDASVNLRISAKGTGRVFVGTGSAINGSSLDVTGVVGGLGVPRLTTAERDAIASPGDGLVVYNTTALKFQGRAGGVWVDFH